MKNQSRFEVRNARKNKMRCYVVVDNQQKKLVRHFDNDLKKNVEHFWAESEANELANYLVKVVL